MPRINQAHMEAKVRIVNGLLGFDTDKVEYLTVGSVRLDGAYGGWAVELVDNDQGGVHNLTGGHGTARECTEFLSGMIAALRIAKGDNP